MLRRINDITTDVLLRSNYRFLRHLLLLLIVALITVNVLWDEPTIILSGRYMAWTIYFLIFIVVIYANMYGIVPHVLLKGKTKRYMLLMTLLMLFFLGAVGTLQSMVDEDGIPTRTPPLIGITSGFSTFFLFISGLTALQFLRYRVRNQQKIAELENATMVVELSNLQNQINPHFLFNMLNNANIMVAEDAQISSDILSKLNDLLRYQVDKSAEKVVKLRDELVFLQDYLELEKLRRDRFGYTIHVEGDTDIDVPPLLFIPFVENAVKHNPENDAYVELVFRNTKNKLYFECKNNKAKWPVVKKEGGIGLVNIRKRLDLLFEEEYTLQLLEEKWLYTVRMEINLAQTGNLSYFAQDNK